MPINIYATVGPFVLALIVIEFIYCLVKKNGYYSFQDSIIGLGTMIFSQCVNLAIASVILTTYGWIYNNFAITQFELTPLNFVWGYILSDFLFYWFHRAGHRINFFWGAHAGHHSAEELNYAVALRTTIFQRAASFLFYWPMAWLGFSPQLILTIVAINLVFQFLPHTRVIPKLPKWIDYWMNTPYHHRIHHAANPIYWDKNYGGTLIIWDRMFGTYADETEEVYYGITMHPKSWDPTFINFHWYTILWKDMTLANNIVDKYKLWFMPPGWRPRNLGPYEKDQPGKTAENQIKYQTESFPGSHAYLIAQLFFAFPVLFFITGHHTPVDGWEQFYYSVLLWTQVTIWGAFMERKSWAIIGEAIRILVTALSLVYTLQKYSIDPMWTYAVIGASAIYLGWLNLIKVQAAKTLRA
jgi:sterol desaturase/sphingolipid hydroxylase (fatty acid hydroxylase superfamily)